MKKTLCIVLGFAVLLFALYGLSFLNNRDGEETAADITQELRESDMPAEPDSRNTAQIVFAEDRVYVQGDGATAEGSCVTIGYPGTYTLSGEATDARVVVDCDYEGDLVLVLDGLTLASADGPALLVEQAKDGVVVWPAEDTVSTLSDSAAYRTFTDAEGQPWDNQPDAALYSRDDLTISGPGTLQVIGNYADAIHGRDDVSLTDGTLILTAVEDGVKSSEDLLVLPQSLNITAGEDGLQSANAGINLAGGEITLSCGGDGIAALEDILIQAGTVAVTTGSGHAGYAEAASAEISTRALKGRDILVIGGSLRVNSADDAVHADDMVIFSGGSCRIFCGNDALSAGAEISVLDGELTVECSYEGLEAPVVCVSGGETIVYADNNAVSSGVGAPEDGYEATDCAVTVTGGVLRLFAPCCVNTDGTFVLYDGAVFLQPGTEGTPIEAGLGVRADAGLLLACGHLENNLLGEDSSLPSVLYQFPTAVSGAEVTLTTEDGTECLNWLPEQSYDSVLIAYAGLNDGDSFTVSCGETAQTFTQEGLQTLTGSFIAPVTTSSHGSPGGGRRQ